LIHSGSAESGHYYSYIKIKEKWYEFNDRIVTEFNLQNNLKSECFGGAEGKNKNAYMLFY
jgi:ubiquitin C-terminal hydrolase